jgi:CheY-like chemotaxis protein
MVKSVILVVDDNLNNLYVTRAALERFGHKIDVADNGIDAVKAATDKFYDLIIMDCRMPILDGYEATEEIRRKEAERGRRTPIVALTACALDGDREKCLAAGMDDYFTKPITLEGFREILERWLKSSQMG